MSKNHKCFMRLIAPLAMAGVLLQTGGCMSGDLLNSLLLGVLGSFVQGLVAGGFNLV